MRIVKPPARHREAKPWRSRFERRKKAVNKIKTILGYIWGFLAILIVLATFMGNEYFSRKLANTTGVTISPWYSGGEIVNTIDHSSYKTLVHRPVFDGLIWEKKDGFVQINWEPFSGLPPLIEEKIDYNGDRREDFLVKLDTATGKASLVAYSPDVVSVENTYKLTKGWAVRVLLNKKP